MQNKKKCSCGKEYTLSEFKGLESVGVQVDMENQHLWLDYRNCTCGSTITLLFDGSEDTYCTEQDGELLEVV